MTTEQHKDNSTTQWQAQHER